MSLETLFEDFQGRTVKKRKRIKLEDRLPSTMYVFGTAVNVLYDSDKRDPGDPHGDGRQGVWKVFTHEHGSDVSLYSCESAPGEKGWDVPWPDQVAWLGKLKEIKYLDLNGKEHTENITDMDLWVWHNDRIMMGISRNLADIKDVIIWKGGSLRVEGRGIVK